MNTRSEENNVHINFSTEVNKDNKDNKYNNECLKMQYLDISQGFYFAVSKHNNIKKYIQQSEVKTEKGEDLILRIRKSKNKNFTIENPINKRMERTKANFDNLNNKIWYILNTNETRKDNNNKINYIINKNDIIKFNNSMYEVIEKYDKNNDNDKVNIICPYNISKINESSESIFMKDEINTYQYKNEDQENLCRICFDGSSSVENPKICLCKCNDYIHYKCLKRWIKSKTKYRENKNVLSYFIKKFWCEVCLTPYPLKFKIAEICKEYSLVHLKLPISQNFFILESIDNSLEPNIYKSIHIVKLINDRITFGRNELCDIMDLRKISNYHAIFKYDRSNGNLILENRSERFDSYVLVKNPIVIKRNKIDLKIRKTLVTANLYNDNE